MWSIVLIVWVVCGILAAGIEFAFLQRAFPLLAKRDYKKDLIASYLFGLGGVISIMKILVDIRRVEYAFKYGFKFW